MNEPPRTRLEPRTVTMVSALAATIALVTCMFALPVPYILEGPGPTVDTLGAVDGVELIQVEQEPSHPMTGQLRLTTVTADGADRGSLSLLKLVAGYFDDADALVPYEALYPRPVTRQEREEENAAQMVSSQNTATAAALEHLGRQVDVIVSAVPDGPSLGLLRPKDKIVSVNGHSVLGYGSLIDQLRAIAPGESAAVGLERDGQAVTVHVITEASDRGGSQLGVGVEFNYSVKVSFGLEGIGGSSAGLMFALGIVDKLGEVDLAAGHVIAGTGTMDADGTVGAIGGIIQKMTAAKRDGAEFFLAPAGNCEQAAGKEPPGLELVKVSTLEEALDALAAIRRGALEELPRCG